MGMRIMCLVGLVSESALKKFGGDAPEDSIPYIVSFVCLYVLMCGRGEREREGGKERKRGEAFIV